MKARTTLMKTKKLYVYCLPPIDYWIGWQDVESWLLREDVEGSYEIPEYTKMFEAGKRLAKEIGWAGDICEGPFITGLPPHWGEHTSDFIIGWKDDDNGTTYIVSPRELPWLKEEDSMWKSWVSGRY